MPKKDSTAPVGPPSYEEAFTRLEALVNSLESGDIPLAQLVAKFEEGHRLLRICQEHLHAAELKIEQLKLDETGAPVFAPFAEESQS
jgi:exodeoxyribonuclease VII small subunit